MPVFVLRTNVKIQNVREFVTELSALGAKTLDKPEVYMSVQYVYDPDISFSGTFDPHAVLSIESLGNINPEVNEQYCPVFFKFIEQKLNVPADRAYVTFADPGWENFGYKGTTFAALKRNN